MKIKSTLQLSLLALSLITSTLNAADQKGLIISGLGLAGCGKSTTFQELHKLMPDSLFFAEAEQEAWPVDNADRTLYDHFTHFSAFRAMRVPCLRKADKLRDQGKIVFLDSYYDKVNAYYLGRDLVSWLIPKDHKYFDLALDIAKRDIEELPDADVIVLFDIDYDCWKTFITNRNRDQDMDDNFQNQYEAHKYYEEAAEKLAKERNVKIVRLKQEFSSPQETAKRLYKILQEENIIPGNA